MELMLSREHCKIELGGLWEAELTHFLPCAIELLNWAKPKGYILIRFLELVLHHETLYEIIKFPPRNGHKQSILDSMV